MKERAIIAIAILTNKGPLFARGSNVGVLNIIPILREEKKIMILSNRKLSFTPKENDVEHRDKKNGLDFTMPYYTTEYHFQSIYLRQHLEKVGSVVLAGPLSICVEYLTK